MLHSVEFRRHVLREHLKRLQKELYAEHVARMARLILHSASSVEKEIEARAAKIEMQQHFIKCDESRRAFDAYHNLTSKLNCSSGRAEALTGLQFIREEFERTVPDERYHFLHFFL